ncbi:MAG: ABC-2 type transport system ATP-binding protein [Myxococcota bacterium]
MAGSVTPLLEVRDLRKTFRKVAAVDGVSFSVGAGELLGFIGPNGAGKSTTVKIITGQLLADAGQVLVDGHDILAEPLAARRVIGYVPQDLALYPFLTGRELLEFVAEVRGIPAVDAAGSIDQLLKRFRLADAQNRLTREYSEGMARKLSISAALLGNPRLLVLDESLTGLDPRAAAEVKAILSEELDKGVAVVLVSHILDVLERLCTRMVLIDRGVTVSQLDADQLAELSSSGTTLEQYFLDHTDDPDA